MDTLSVIGRGLYLQPYLAKYAYVGCVSTSPDKSNRDHDVVQSLPCHSPSEAIIRGRQLRDMISAQAQGFKALIVVGGKVISL